MIFIDTDEKFNWLLEVFESDYFHVVSRKLTEEDKEEISREIAEYKATHPKTPARDMVLA
jgi:molybdopterin biosynthesis enzyme MoaB